MALQPGSASSASGPPRRTKNTMAELRLRRLQEHNLRLKEDLARPRIRVSEASMSLISYCTQTRDPLLPSLWGELRKGEDPYAPPEAGCCLVM
ncbi:Guanine nucleotide-binding protein subunit gamma [Apiotrichum porosum]|uniref:Guanine nucleotide-binding protein subunit gamma n=1 Tax=Apiotrichum porosum TaxID=105984 RepID=A0A427Y6H0_9TREE|nr:Guanine nucleotide-binding protein subunit gamma [Apiotrichum porosum]RSH86688.1 Guanine nucleotide-binding protein subunit gamma [Apiotrichum porosum]